MVSSLERRLKMRVRTAAVLLLTILMIVSLAGAASSKPGGKPAPANPEVVSICYSQPDVVVTLKGIKTGMRLTVFTVVGDDELTTYAYPATGTAMVTVDVGETQPEFAEATLAKPARKDDWRYIDSLATNPELCTP